MYANKTQTLIDHLKSCAVLAKTIAENIGIQDETERASVIKLAFLAAILHDIGKIDRQFQEYLQKAKAQTSDLPEDGVHLENIAKTKKEQNKFFNENFAHNELSYAIVLAIIIAKAFTGLNKSEKEILRNCVFWHHAKPNRKDDIEDKICSEIKARFSKDADLNAGLHALIPALASTINEAGIGAGLNYKDALNEFDGDIAFPSYTPKYSDRPVSNLTLDDVQLDINFEARTSLVRSIVIMADRLVSSGYVNMTEDRYDVLVKEVLEKRNSKNICAQIEKMEQSEVFTKDSQRCLNQNLAAAKLAEVSNKQNRVAVLNGPAGSGKTKISLQWAKNSGVKKLYYVVPRVVIAKELFDELKDLYLEENVSIEICTGDYKEIYNEKNDRSVRQLEVSRFDADIVITTIDQISKSITTHKNATLVLDLLAAHVVFDEFHEIVKIKGFNLLFAELVRLKQGMQHPKTLLMSATVNYFALKNLLCIYDERETHINVVDFKTFNQETYAVQTVEYEEGSDLDPFCKPHPNYADRKKIVITNTAKHAQLDFISHQTCEDSLLAHSKFSTNDKKNVFEKIKSEFRNIERKENNILRSGPIVQASLNITCHDMLTDYCSPEDTLQRIGRLNRYGDNFTATIVIAKPVGKDGNKVLIQQKVLNNACEKQTTEKWFETLKQANGDWTLDGLYDLYKKFHHEEENKTLLSSSLLSLLKKSYEAISDNLIDPIRHMPVQAKDKRLASNSIRGCSYYCKFAICEIENGVRKIEQYTEPIAVSKNDLTVCNSTNDVIAFSVKTMKKLGVDYAAKIKKDHRLLALALREDCPLWISFTDNHLKRLNVKKNEDKSILYVIKDGDVIGFMRCEDVEKI